MKPLPYVMFIHPSGCSKYLTPVKRICLQESNVVKGFFQPSPDSKTMLKAVINGSLDKVTVEESSEHKCRSNKRSP
jgi:hypothetical protein